MIFWLVVDLPLWKIWKSVGMIIPNIYIYIHRKIKFMSQTTNQIFYYPQLRSSSYSPEKIDMEPDHRVSQRCILCRVWLRLWLWGRATSILFVKRLHVFSHCHVLAWNINPHVRYPMNKKRHLRSCKICSCLRLHISCEHMGLSKIGYSTPFHP